MAQIGQTNRMKIQRITDRGAFVDAGELGDVLVPRNQVPRDANVGDRIAVFLYPEAGNKFIGMTDIPVAEVGECAFLKVVEINDVGAFLDWGIGKNLFLPFGEQPGGIKVGRSYVVYIYLDNTGRIAASTKLKKFLGKIPPSYSAGDEVSLMVTRPTELGWECVANDEFLGLIFNNDALGRCKPGAKLDGYIKAIREGGLVDLSLQPPQMTRRTLGEQILDHLRKAGGTSSLTDKSDPAEIYATFGVSKRAYKDALGGLYRQRKVDLEPGLVKLIDVG